MIMADDAQTALARLARRHDVIRGSEREAGCRIDRDIAHRDRSHDSAGFAEQQTAYLLIRNGARQAGQMRQQAP